MPRFDFSLRDRHSLKWHLNSLTIRDRAEDKNLDKVWTALKLDDIITKPNTDPDALDVAKVPYELTVDERDHLITWLDQPKMGAMSRLLRDVDKALLKSRDEEPSA